MTTELSTMYPENGGFVLWAKGAFGDAAGGMAGWMQFSFSAVDSALYPGLFVVYLSQTLQTEFGPEWTLWLQAGFICSITALNLGGIDSVGHGSMAMMLFLLLPFALVVLIAFTGIFSGTTITGWPFHIENLLETVPEVSPSVHMSFSICALIRKLSYSRIRADASMAFLVDCTVVVSMRL